MLQPLLQAPLTPSSRHWESSNCHKKTFGATCKELGWLTECCSGALVLGCRAERMHFENQSHAWSCFSQMEQEDKGKRCPILCLKGREVPFSDHLSYLLSHIPFIDPERLVVNYNKVPSAVLRSLSFSVAILLPVFKNKHIYCLFH